MDLSSDNAQDTDWYNVQQSLDDVLYQLETSAKANKGEKGIQSKNNVDRLAEAEQKWDEDMVLGFSRYLDQ
jgi:hypothetical protein